MGDGPYRVWKNRRKGNQFGIWTKEYNNTETGEKHAGGTHGGDYLAGLTACQETRGPLLLCLSLCEFVYAFRSK